MSCNKKNLILRDTISVNKLEWLEGVNRNAGAWSCKIEQIVSPSRNNDIKI